MTKKFLVFAAVVFSACVQIPVFAQSIYSSTSVPLKTALVDYLYQYGKEMYLRGVDVQEASYVLQRALVLDCHHQGAQAYLNKLHQKYPDVSVRIWGCPAQEAPAVTAVESQSESKTEEAKGELRHARKSARLNRNASVQPDDLKLRKTGKPAANLARETQPTVPEETKVSDQTNVSQEATLTAEGAAGAGDLITPSAAQTKKPARAAKATKNSSDNAALRKDFKNAQDEMEALKNELKQKDEMIARYKSRLAARNFSEDMDDYAYSKLARDQKDLIRIQQNNIDYLKSELSQLRKQSAAGSASPDTYTKNQMDVAASGLEAQESKIAAEFKDQESRDLRQRLTDLQEQLALVQKLVDEKNKTIASLESELRAAEPAATNPPAVPAAPAATENSPNNP